MNDLLNVPNPEEKIKNIVKEAVLQKQNESQKVNKELENLKQQEASGVYYTPINMNPESTVQFVATAIASLLIDVLYGLKEGIEFVKQDVNKIQSGGGGIEKFSMADIIDNDANKLLTMIGGAIEKTKKAINPSTNTSTTTSIPSSPSSLGEQSSSLSSVAFSKAKDVGEAGVKTGIKWSADALGRFIDYVMTLTGEESILETPIDKLSPGLNSKVLLIAGILKELSTNPATKQAIKEIAKAFAITMDDFIDEIREPTIEIAGHAIELMKNVAAKFVSGVTATTISVIQAFLAEIPWLGGIIDLFIAIGKAFNTLMATYKIFVGKSSPILITGATTINNTKKMATTGVARIKNAAQKSMKDIQTAIQGATTTPTAPAVPVVPTAVPVVPTAVPVVPTAVPTAVPVVPTTPVVPATPATPVVPATPATPATPVVPATPAPTSPWVQKKGLKGNVFWKNEKTGKVSDTQPEGWNPTSNVQSGGSINNAIIRGGKRLRKTMKQFHNTLPKLKYTCVNKDCKFNKSKSKKKKRNKSKRR
jgi:hypothetical protein